MESYESDSQPGRNEPVDAATSRRLVWISALGAGLAAGFAAWMIGEASHDRLQPKILATGGIPTIEEAQAGAGAMKKALALQAAVAFAASGSALGLALGLAGGAARRSPRPSLIGAALGTLLGGVAGAAAPLALLPVYFAYYDPDRDDLLLALLTQGGIGAAVGAAGGASFGIGSRRGRVVRALAGGMLGAVVGVLIYEFMGTLAFPLDQTTRPISATSATRLLNRLLLSILAAAGAVIGEGAGRKAQTSPTTV